MKKILLFILYILVTLILCFASYKFGQNEGCYPSDDDWVDLDPIIPIDSLSETIVRQDKNVFDLYLINIDHESDYSDFTLLGMAMYCSGRFNDDFASFVIYQSIKSWQENYGLTIDKDSKAIALHYLRKAAAQNNEQAIDELKKLQVVKDDTFLFAK